MKNIIRVFLVLSMLLFSLPGFAKLSNDEFVDYCGVASYTNIKKMLDEGYDVNVVQKNPLTLKTPLDMAIIKNPDDNVIKLLIERGAFINAKSLSGTTPIFYAVESNRNMNIIEYLINNGADLNSIDDYRGSLIMTAVRKYKFNKKNLVNLLIQKGADVNNINRNNESILEDAIWKQGSDIEIIKLLISAGANVNYCDKSGKTILSKAIESENLELFDILVQNGADIHYKNSKNETILEQATFINPSAIDKLVEYGYTLPSEELFKVLINAIHDDNVPLVQKLIDYGADPNTLSIKKYDNDVWNQILNVSNRYNSKFEYCKTTPLEEAIFYGKNIDIVKILLENGAVLFTYDIDKVTGHVLWNKKISILDLVKEKYSDISVNKIKLNYSMSYEDSIIYLKKVIELLEEFEK